MNIDNFIYSINNLWHRKTRSFLTVLSILIGIMAIFGIISFGIGIRSYMDKIAEQAGTDKLFLQAKGIGGPTSDPVFYLSKDDLDFVGRIKGVQDITGMYFSVVEIKYNKEIKYQFMIGFDMDKIYIFKETGDIKVVKGRELKPGELGKVVLGYNYQFENKNFKRAIKLGDKVEINGISYDVVGFFSEAGNPQDDAQIYVTNEQYELLYPEKKNKFSYSIIKAEKGVDPSLLADRITEKLRKHKGQEKGKEDFYVQTFSDLLETFGNIINILNGVLILIAFVSLIVAFVNIMNTMYTAVLERTQEIGIMKAIGASNQEIINIFVLESGLLGFIGGVTGVIAGYFIASTGGAIAAGYGYSLLKPIFPWYLTLGCILFATLVGILAGLLPAYQASKLKPVDALRYE